MARFITFPAFALVVLAGCSSSGPAIMQWEYTGGPYAQNIATVMADARTTGAIYAALTSGEISLSTDGGKSWEHHSGLGRRIAADLLVQDPETPERFFAATGSGAFVSTNRGKEWTAMQIGRPGTGVRVLAIDPWSPSVLFAGTAGNGIYRTTDGGKTWSEANAGGDTRVSTADVTSIVVDAAKPDVIYAASPALGILRSTDGGATWGTINQEVRRTGSRETHLLVLKGGVLLYGTDAGEIAKSTNSGASWSPTRRGLESDRIISLVAHPSNPDFVLAGTNRGIIASSDFGTTWTAAGGDLPRVATHLAVSAAGGQAILFAYGSGIGLKASTDNGATWEAADRNLGGATVSVMTADRQGDHLYVAAGSACLPFRASPGKWEQPGTGITGGEISSLCPDPEMPAALFATTPGGVFQTTDYGVTWQPTARALQMSPVLFELHPSINTRAFATNDQGLLVSTDRGSTWRQPLPHGTHWHVQTLSFSPADAGIIFAATPDGGVLITHDGGFQWEQVRYGLPEDQAVAVTFDDKDPDIVFLYYANGECFRSLNKGLEWNRYSPPWKTADSVRLACDRYQPSDVIALVRNREIYFSASGGGTWFRLLDANIPSEVIALCWNAASRTLYAGTPDGGVYRLLLQKKLSELVGQ